jgi:hypothetical protein
MSTLKSNDWKNLYIIGGIAALVQLAAILIYTVAMVVLGPKPTSVEEYFMLQHSNRMASVLRGDFLLLFLLAPYFGTFPALWMALRRTSPIAATFATLFTFVAVTICFAFESTFALQYLGNKYALATSEAQRT